jgi:nucleoside-diphosphate-sugar epimerase
LVQFRIFEGVTYLKILVIGGTKFIGPVLVNRLSEMGHEITLFHRGKTKADLRSNVNEILGDRKHLSDFKDEFKRLSPDVVVDMIPMSKHDALSVMDTFKGIASRVVAITSQDVYRAYGLVKGIETGDLEPIPITEGSSLREKLYPYREEVKEESDPKYNYEKILVEKVILSGESGLNGTILRLPVVYGPKDEQHRFSSYLKRMDDKRSFILLDENFAQWRWTHAYVENVAYAIALAATDERSTGRIYNVGEPKTVTMYDFVKEIGKKVGWEGEILTLSKDRIPSEMRFPGNSKQHIVIDSTRLRKELGFSEIVSFEEGIERTIQWERSNPSTSNVDYRKEDKILSELGIL